MKNIIALIMSVILVFSVMSVSVYAEDAAENIVVSVNGVDFIFDKDTSEDFRNKFIENYFNPHEDGAEAYGLTCTLLGHDIENSVSTVITHKVSSTAPRCLRETYSVDTCTRCDYSNATLLQRTYIYCC